MYILSQNGTPDANRTTRLPGAVSQSGDGFADPADGRLIGVEIHSAVSAV